MAKKSLKTRAIEIAQPVIEEMGYELVDIEYKNPGGPWRLTVFIHKEDGIQFEDCENVSHALDELFDADEDMLGRYDFLQISSPGLDRPLKSTADYRRNMGKNIDLSMFTPVLDSKKMTAKLVDVNEEAIVIHAHGEDVAIERKNIAKAVLAIEF